MIILDEAIDAYNDKTKRAYTRSIQRAAERDVRDRAAVATKANELLRLEGHDEVVWSELEPVNAKGVLVYRFAALGYQLIGYMDTYRYRWRAGSAPEAAIEMKIAPWGTFEASSIHGGLYTEGYDRIDSFADFGEAILAHMYEHQMPDRIQVGTSRGTGRYGGDRVLDNDLWYPHVWTHSVGDKGLTRIDKYEQMLQRYRAMGGPYRQPQRPSPTKPVLAAAAISEAPKPKRGLFCWSKPR
jgi:hypothetical protein